MHSLSEVSSDVKRRSLRHFLLDLEALIKDNFPKLPPEPKENDSLQKKLYFKVIENVQTRLAEILVFLAETIPLKEYPDRYTECTETQKKVLEFFFEAAKILSLAITSKLALKVIPEKAAAKIRRTCEECYTVEIKIKNPQALTQIKKTEISKLLDNGLRKTVSYAGFSGATIVEISCVSENMLIVVRQGSDDKVILEYNKIKACKEKLNNAYNPSFENEIRFLNSRSTQSDKTPKNQPDSFVDEVTKYVMQYPVAQPFLTSITENNYDQALRHACNLDNIYLLNLLLDFSKTGTIKLNLNAASTNGKTALHWSAESASKNNHSNPLKFKCLKSLLTYSRLNAGGIDLNIKDKTQKTYKDYLSKEDQESVDDILFALFDSINTVKFVSIVTKYVEENPSSQPFLESIIKKDYYEAIRESCFMGNTYLLNLLLDFSKTEAITLNLLSTDKNGKTAFHNAAISGREHKNLDCLKILADFVPSSNLAIIDFIKDKKNNTFEDYLDPQLRMDFNIYLDNQYISDHATGEIQTSFKF